MLDPCRVLEWAYGPQYQETGRNTLGHRIVSAEDREKAGEENANLLYGEVLPVGVSTLLDPQHLNAGKARKLVDIGSGCGKLALQAFVEFPNLEQVLGVEICRSRNLVGMKAIQEISKRQPQIFQIVDHSGDFCRISMDDSAASDPVFHEEFKNGGRARGQLGDSENLPHSPVQQQQHPPISAAVADPPLSLHQHQRALTPHRHHHHQIQQQQQQQQHQAVHQALLSPFAHSAQEQFSPLGKSHLPLPCHHALRVPVAVKPPSRLAKLASFAQKNRKRTLELREGNMFHCGKDLADADVIVCETKVPQGTMQQLHELVCGLKRGARLLTYDDLGLEFELIGLPMPVRRIGNRDRVLTSWAVSFGHMFHLWERV